MGVTKIIWSRLPLKLKSDKWCVMNKWLPFISRGFSKGFKSYPNLLSKEMDLSDLRVPYSSIPFLEENLVSKSNPMAQFKNWFETALKSPKEEQPNAACLSTCSSTGYPSSRMLLVKKFDDQGFTFFTNHNSRKGKEVSDNPHACLLFFWPSLHRQVRIEGDVSKIPDEQSDAYFNSRPLGSKISAIVSPQSEEVTSREDLQVAHDDLEAKCGESGDGLKRPSTWGGFIVRPKMFEFWQGQTNRLHDRIVFIKHPESDTWTIKRLAP